MPSDYRPGNRVWINCQKYRSIGEIHGARIVSEVYTDGSEKKVIVKHFCTGNYRKSIVPISEIVKKGRHNMKLSTPAIITGIVLGTVMLVFLWFTGNYNSLVGAKNQTDQSWSQVETQYQRRLDLVGNLVASTKGAQGQEREVFGKIAEARTQYNNATTSSDKAAAASSVETNVALIPRLQEAYPELKSNQQVQSLMNQLTGTEDGILAARDNYNKVATNYNTNIERFPKNVFANIFGFKPFALFKAKAAAANAPEVKF